MNPLLVILLLILLGANTAAEVGECDQEKSRQEVQRLSAAAVIISTAQFLPYVTVVVDQRWWSRSSLEEKAALTPGPIAVEFELRGAQALNTRYPELARKLLDQALIRRLLVLKLWQASCTATSSSR